MNMTKIISLLLAITMLALSLASCNASGAGDQLTIQELSNVPSVGDSVQLQVVSASGKSVKADQCLWSTSDSKVATVDANGLLTVKGAGYCEIHVMNKNDLSNQDTLVVFCPYEVTAPVDMIMERADANGSSSGGADYMMKTAVSLGKKVVSSLTGNVSMLGIATMMLSFFAKDKYTFTLAESRHSVQNGVIYTVCDWSNEAQAFSMDQITAESLYGSMGDVMNTEHQRGDTFADLEEAVRLALVQKIPADGVFHFDQMDDRYEYRVVILADYTTFRMTDYYSNGAITGLGMTIQEICSMSLESITDVNNNWMYEIVTNDVIDVENVRFCIEYREKQ
jgi:hypothetical protein